MTQPSKQDADTTDPATIPPWIVDAPIRIFFGGSFDPPHLGHTTLPERVAHTIAARAGLEPHCVPIVFVPAARSPHKNEAPTDPSHRLAMLGLALRHMDHPHALWGVELDRARAHPGAPSYWGDTWSRVRELCPRGENRFLIGADQALSMHRWRGYGSFWRDAVVMLRPGTGSAEALIGELGDLGVWSKDELAHWAGTVVRVERIDASSSAIRDALRDGAKRKHPIAGLDDRVRSYILEHALYRSA